MSTVTLHHRTVRREHNYGVLAQALPMHWKSLYFFGFLLLVSLLFFYVFSINQLTFGAYAIKNYHKQIGVLSAKNRDLESRLAQANFLGNAQQRAQVLGFEKTANVAYVQVLEGSLAKAR